MPHDLSECQAMVEAYLPKALERIGAAPPALRDAMAYSLLAPGKRLRPALVLMACDAIGGDAELALPAAAAVEMVHTYSLIHDDLPAMDDDDLRRGRPTCHKKFGEALAILAGDALLTLSFQLLTDELPAKNAVACCRELALGAGACGMVGGQVEDIAWEARPSGKLADLEHVHVHKTGALFRTSLRLGAFVADANPPKNVLSAFDEFGLGLGLAFQITDDLLDVEGRTEDAGKRVNKDNRRGKLTYPGLLGVVESRRQAADQCRAAADALATLGKPGAKLIDLLGMILHRDR